MMKYRKISIFLIPLLIWGFSISAGAMEPCHHDFQPVGEPASCTEPGYEGLICTICFQTKDYTSIPKLGHDWEAWTVTDPPDCTSMGLQIRTCFRCQETQQEVVPRLEHEYSIWIQKPTCGQIGYTLHTCVFCGHEEKTNRVEALGHDLVVLVVEPSCTKDGYTKYQCTRCTYSRKENLTEKTGHLYDTGDVIKESGLNETGKIRYTCLNCGDIKTETIPKWNHPFLDVEKAAYYRDSVTWAYHTGITTGTDQCHFSPDVICTRGQVLTFLWRWAGSPEPKTPVHPFVDVKPGAYYEKPVIWAMEKGITNGVDETHFAPNAGCSRAQVVTLIHRYQGSPVAKGELPFVDISQEKYYSQSVLWAYKNKITTGVSASVFDPDGLCTRGQIVTFLYRASNV